MAQPAFDKAADAQQQFETTTTARDAPRLEQKTTYKMNKFLVAVFLISATLAAADWAKQEKSEGSSVHTITFAVNHKAGAAATCDSLLNKISNPASPLYSNYLELSQVESMFIDREAVKRVENFLEERGFEYETIADYIKVTATLEEIEGLIGAKYHDYIHPQATGVTLRRTESYNIPKEIQGDIQTILGTVGLPPLKTAIATHVDDVAATPITTPSLINKFYGVTNNTVKLASQALFEALGQTYSPADLTAFQTLYKLPKLQLNKIHGNNNAEKCKTDPNACGEANLDVQYMTAIAQGTTNYWSISQSEQDPFFSWILTLAKEPKPALVHSISYGSLAYRDPITDMTRFNTETCKLGLRGLTIVVSSGDDGVSNFPVRRGAQYCGYVPSFPATCPYVLAVGATQGPEEGKKEIACTSSTGGLITTGGGFAKVFKRPAYQNQAVSNYLAKAPGLPPKSDFASGGRGYPDIAAMGHNYVIIDGGKQLIVSGTSASAPVIGAFITLINEERMSKGKKSLGFVNPALYKAPSSLFNDITVGRNNCGAGRSNPICCKQGFNATTGWDPLTGLGTPKFQSFKNYFVQL
eukprot:TRINITY_DN675_c0_g1_i1.p1 TRINITY_DN675_c0_g1~~TRINITY_DN675_c0_g1_i1.p1  ORF type:complete len:583 (-),score=226.86 TRINITY_DN675_c0_g1_i1:142-1890(-)